MFCFPSFSPISLFPLLLVGLLLATGFGYDLFLLLFLLVAGEDAVLVGEVLAQGVAVDETLMGEVIVEETLMGEVVVEEILIQGVVVEEILIQEVIVEEILIQEAIVEEISIQEVVVEEILIQGVIVEEILIQEVIVEEILTVIIAIQPLHHITIPRMNAAILMVMTQPVPILADMDILMNGMIENANVRTPLGILLMIIGHHITRSISFFFCSFRYFSIHRLFIHNQTN